LFCPDEVFPDWVLHDAVFRDEVLLAGQADAMQPAISA
jgi:hypothetical protein